MVPRSNISVRDPELNPLDVVILCGGLGKRLEEVVNDRPKPMAEIQGQPFLQILIEYYAEFGCNRFVLCSGYMGDIISRYFNDKYEDKEIVISQESEPLGTGGALSDAMELIRSDNFLVLNGDSFCDINIPDLYEFHFTKEAILSMALVKVDNKKQYGSVGVSADGSISSFNEKQDDSGDGWISSGIYIMNKEIVEYMKKCKKVFSLEYDLFPRLVDKGMFGLKLENNYFFDIGTPESYLKAEKIINEYINKN